MNDLSGSELSPQYWRTLSKSLSLRLKLGGGAGEKSHTGRDLRDIPSIVSTLQMKKLKPRKGSDQGFRVRGSTQVDQNSGRAAC
jgi:hypothetical protein